MIRRASRYGLLSAGAGSLLTLGIAVAHAAPDDAPVMTDGVIKTEALRAGQRIKIDGRVVGISPKSIRVPCGTHTLETGVGTKVRVETVDVPCGGELILGKVNRTVPFDAGPDADLGQSAAAADVPDASSAPAVVETDAGPPPIPEPPPAPPFSLGGRVFTYVRAPIASSPVDTPFQQASASIWLEAKPRLNEWSSAAATLSLDAMHSSIDPDTTLRARVREAYVDAYRDGWEIRAGQQIIPWGNADIFNPTDFLGAKDYAFFATDNEVRRLGALDLWLSFTPSGGSSPLQLIVVWTPILTGSRLLVPGGLLPSGVTNRGILAPVATIDNSEVAARIAYKGTSWDVALVGFRGFNHDPEFFLVSHDAMSTVIAQTYRHILGAGLEASVSAGKWVFRVEGAYVSTENALASDPSLQPAHADGVLGIERPFLERFRFQLQGLVRYFPNHAAVVGAAPTPDPVLFGIADSLAKANAILLNYQDPLIPATTLRLSFMTEDEKFEAEVLGVVNFNVNAQERANFLVRPVLTYHWTEALRFHAGAETFGGPKDSPLGALRPFSGAFLGGDYRF